MTVIWRGAGASRLVGGRGGTTGSSKHSDGLRVLACAADGLKALEERLRLLEDELTSGDPLALPETHADEAGRRLSPDVELIARAHEIGARVRRMNLRLGAIERALDGRAPLGLADAPPPRPARAYGLNDGYGRERGPARPWLVDDDPSWPTAS
jgi:hypothetical protein